jgi:peptide/nickel transport system permease protein
MYGRSFWIYLARRLGLAVITLIGAIVAVFVMTHVLPGNPALVKAGVYSTPEVLKALEHEMGLDRPLPEQLAVYVLHALRGDLGVSTRSGHPVAADLVQRLPATAELALYSVLLAVLIGVPLGITAAVREGGWFDRVVQQLAILGASAPLFWLGIVLIFLLYVKLGVAPAPVGRLDTGVQPPPAVTGLYTIDAALGFNAAALASAAGHLVLPVLTLGFVLMAPLIKMSRASMSTILRADFIQAAASFGLPQRTVVWGDGLKNAMMGLLTVVGIVLGYVMAGNVIVEALFAWPGIGLYAWNGITGRDYDAIQGFILLVAATYVVVNLVIDVLYMLIDPRVRLG